MKTEKYRKEIRVNDNLNVRLTIRGNGTILFGQGVDATNGKIIKKCAAKHRLPTVEAQIPYAERIIVKKIEEKHKKKTSNKKVINVENDIYTAVFESLKDLSLLRKATWGDDTFKQSLTYFQRKVLPLLNLYGWDIDIECVRKIHDELKQIAVNSKRSNSNPLVAETSVGNQMYRANYIYQKLRENSPEYSLPAIDLEISGSRNKIQTELPKSLPDSLRIMLARLLFRLVKTKHGGLAMAVALMLFTGVRPAEAAAVYFGEIAYFDTYAIIVVYRQEKDRKPTLILKSQNAYRCVVLPKIMLDLIAVRQDYLLSQGYSPNDIEKFPITFSGGDPDILERSQDVSALGRKLLRLCNFPDELFTQWYELMQKKPDKVDNENTDDVAAYILRRDWVTRACNICGFRQDQVDYLLGHASPKKQKKDYLTRESQRDLSMRLERYVFDPEHSLNPTFNKQELNLGDNFDLQTNQSYFFVSGDSENVIIIELSVCSSEAGDSISMVTSADLVSDISCFEHRDTPDARKIRPLIGGIGSKGMYEFWISRADKIELEQLEGI